MKHLKQQLLTVLFLAASLTAFAQVGIGTITPEGALDVVSSDSGIILTRVTNTAAVTSPVNGMLIYDIADECTKTYQNGAWSGCLTTPTSIIDANADTQIQVEESTDDDTIRFDTAGTERVVIDNTGNVGIGITPVEALTVDGNIQITNNSFVGRNKPLGHSDLGNESFSFGSIISSSALTGMRVNSIWNGIYNEESIEFSTHLGGVSAGVRMRITSGGNVGIGTTTPITHLLTVNGDASKPTGGSWATFSDQRIKKNIQAYTKGLNEIVKIRTVSYNYNEKSPFKDNGRPMVGIIAQEMQKILPNTVTEIKTGHFDDLLQYDDSELKYTMVNAIKELKALNDTLKEENKNLKTTLEEVLKRLEKLETAKGNE